MGLVGTGCAMNTSKASKTLLLLLLSLAIFASTSGQPRSARQDEADETNLLNEENLENDSEATPEENGEESDQNKGTPEPEPEPETEPEPEPEGSAGHSEGNPETSDDMTQQENSSKKCKNVSVQRSGRGTVSSVRNAETPPATTPTMTTRNLWRRTQTDGGESVDAVPIPSLRRNGRTCASRAGARTCRSLSPPPPLSRSIGPSQEMI